MTAPRAAVVPSPEILVWAAHPPTFSDPDGSRLHALLDASERERAGRFAFERDRRQYMAAHGLKRIMLSALAGPPPRSWAFDQAPHGKPSVRSHAGLHFNLAHCETLVVCAVSRAFELGVDVEPITRAAPLELVRDHFSEPERDWIESLQPAERCAGFLRIWTLKEALVKASGRGLSQPLQAFSFAFDPLRVSLLDADLGDSRAWRFEQREIAGHLVALAWRNDHGVRSESVQMRLLRALPPEATGGPRLPAS